MHAHRTLTRQGQGSLTYQKQVDLASGYANTYTVDPPA